jgi:hypothetical protein
MKKISLVALSMLMILVSSCEVVGDIFNAGVYTGIFLVVFVVVVIIVVIARIFKR